MNRKNFIKTSGIGLGFALVPGIVKAEAINDLIGDNNELAAKIIKKGDGKVYNVIGDIQTHTILGEDTNGLLAEWINHVPPGTGIPPHIHTKEDEVFRVVKGQFELMVGGETFVLNEGDVAFAPRDVVHSWKATGDGESSMVTSAFPAGIELMFHELSELPPGPPDFEKVSAICAKQGISFIQ